MRNHFPNNHRLIGILNDTGNYDLKFDYKSPMNILAKVLLGLILLADFKLKEKKEINLFTDKLLKYHKTEYD